MMSILVIDPLTWKVIRDARNFTAKVEHMRKQERHQCYVAGKKRIAHAEVVLWLATTPNAPTTINAVIRDGLTKEVIRRGIQG